MSHNQPKQPPKIIKEVGFDFSWDVQKVWALDVNAEDMPISELTWHFDIPFLWSKPDGFYDLKPASVLKHPAQFPDEYDRTMAADTSYPIDILFWKNRWVILDGLHRLMKQSLNGGQTVQVRKIPSSAIPRIVK